MFIDSIIDLVLRAQNVPLKPIDRQVLFSMNLQLISGSNLTEKQGNLIIDILKKNKALIHKQTNVDISLFLENPKFLKPFRMVNNTYNVKVGNHSKIQPAIFLETPYNEEMIAKIKAGRKEIGPSIWDSDLKTWVFSVNEKSILFLMSLLSNVDYNADETFRNYVNQIREIEKNLGIFTPYLDLDGTDIVIKNSLEFLPKITAKNVIDAVFEARMLGVSTWSEAVNEIIKASELKDPVISFLNTDPGTEIHYNSDSIDLNDLTEIVKQLSPCLFVLPGGSELEKLEKTLNFLKQANIDNSEISVMFRLSNETDKDFNEFVKIHNINNPITDKTKAVLISTKLPKTILTSNIKFNCVFNYGFGNVYTYIKEYIKNHENLIYFVEKTKQKGLNLGIV